MKKIIIISVILIVVVGVYLYFRNEAQKKGYSKNKTLAKIFGVSYRENATFTPEENTQIASEFENIFNMGTVGEDGYIV